MDDHPDGVTGSVESHGRGADGQRVTPSTTEMENHQSGHDSESERHHGESNPSAGAAQQSPAVTTVPSTTIVPESHSGGGDTSGSDGSDSSKGGSGGSAAATDHPPGPTGRVRVWGGPWGSPHWQSPWWSGSPPRKGGRHNLVASEVASEVRPSWICCAGGSSATMSTLTQVVPFRTKTSPASR